MAYCLVQSPKIVGVHDVFHISMLRKYVLYPTHVFPLEPLQLQVDATFVEQSVLIIDTKDQTVLRTKTIQWVDVPWEHHRLEEATWEPKYQIRKAYPSLLPDEVCLGI